MKLKSGNIVHADGRIYESEDGVAKTVSPYAPDFFENIEDDIRPLIEILRDKGYLPYSSCAGHQVVKRRFVAVAFPSVDRARQFIKDTRSLYENTLITFSIKSIADYYSVGHSSNSDTCNYLNGIFYRGYSHYCFVELSIGSNTIPSLHTAHKLLYRFLFRDFITFKLVNALSKLQDYDQ
jgi:hypothetical protein